MVKKNLFRLALHFKQDKCNLFFCTIPDHKSWARARSGPGIPTLGNLGLCELDSSSKLLFFT